MASIEWVASVVLTEYTWMTREKKRLSKQTLVFAITHWVEKSFAVNVYSVEWVRSFFSPFIIGSNVLIRSDLFILWLGQSLFDFVPIYTFQANRKIVSETKIFFRTGMSK